MRVLVVVHTFPPQSTGGAQTYAHAQARALAARGHQVTVLTREADPARPEYSVRTERAGGFDVVWVNNTFRATRSFAETYANPAIDDVAARVADAFGPDVAHVHHLTCLSTGIVSLLRARGVPVIVTLHDYWLLCHRGQLLDTNYRLCAGPGDDGCGMCLGVAGGVGAAGFAAARIVRAVEDQLPAAPARWLRHAAAQAAAVVAAVGPAPDEAKARADHMRGIASQVTQFLAPAEAIATRFAAWGVPADRISFWPLGHGVASFRSAGDAAPARGSGPLRLGFLGGLMISKAPHLVVDAIAGLPAGAATVDLFGAYSPYHGDDSYRASVDRLGATPGVTVHGSIPHDAVPAALASIDVLVVPSIWPESVPLVVREAFLAGVPVVGSRIGGIPEAVTHGVNGLLFEPGDAGGLRRAIASLIDSPALLETLRRGARASSVRTMDDDVDATEQLYRSLARARRPRLAAIVLHFGNPDETRIAVRRLLASRRPIDDLIVVDNDPARRCAGAVADIRDRLIYLESPANLGFSAGINLGIREALLRGAERVFIVNNDVVVPPDAIGRLERAIESDPRVGAAGPVVLSRRDPSVVQTMGIRYDAATGRMRHPEFGRRAGDAASRVSGHRVVDAICGCAMLLTRRAIDAVGVFDDAFFFSFEDLDWCLRADRAGFTSVIALEARVYHEGSASMGESPERLYHAARGHLKVAAAAPAGSAVRRTIQAASIAALNLAHAIRASGGTMAARIGAVARGTRDQLRGR